MAKYILWMCLSSQHTVMQFIEEFFFKEPLVRMPDSTKREFVERVQYYFLLYINTSSAYGEALWMCLSIDIKKCLKTQKT